MRYFLSLGSNLEDKAENLKKAVTLLIKESLQILKVSSVYETQPTDYIYQPWFLNQVIEIETEHESRPLFSILKQIEKKMGRKKTISKGPRIIDIDILLNDMNVLNTPELIIPHPLLEKRNFVLVPLSEIAPDIIHPVLGKKIKELLLVSEDRSQVIKFEPVRIKKKVDI